MSERVLQMEWYRPVKHYIGVSGSDKKIKILPDRDSGYISVATSDYMRAQINFGNVADYNSIEKLEQEQIDDKYILRWTARFDKSLIDWNRELQEKKIFRRAHSGLIYKPRVFGETGMLVLFTDWGFILEYSYDNLLTTLTTARIWYNKIPYSKQPHIVVSVASPVSQVLFDLPEVIVPHLIWTNKYELPPLSAVAIESGINTLKKAIEPLIKGHSTEFTR